MIRQTTQTASALVLTALVSMAATTPTVAQVAGGFGVGTSTPDAALHVFRDDKTAQLHIQDASAALGNQVLLLMETATGSPIVRYRGPFRQWDFTGGNFFTINDPSSGSIEMKVKTGGDMTISGDFFSATCTSPCAPAAPDFVFEEDYPLMSLEELRAYLAQEKHLPDIPSAAELEEQGHVNVSKMQMLLLQKIEELTLYTLQQQQTILAQQQMLAEVQARLTAIDGNGRLSAAPGSGSRD